MGLSEEDIQFIKDKFPPPYNTRERYEEFIRLKTQMHSSLCSTVISDINKILASLKNEFHHRFFSRIDDTHTLKTPASIVEKLRRSPEKYDLNNFGTTMTDVARFRIVCNFLTDAEKIADCIEKNEKLNEHFHFVEGKKSTVNLHPEKRSSGERSIKFILKSKSKTGLCLEIQIMTQLQEAWDKKDHFLVYEKRRREPGKNEEKFPDYLDAKMFAMGELLYVADHYFDDLRRKQEDDNNETP